MGIIESVLVAASLCADCFAVSLCSSVTLHQIRWRSAGKVALCFALIQSALLLAGWAGGNLFAGFVYKAAHIIGFLLLLYVGGSMLIEGIKGEEDVKDLGSLRNIIIGGIATSIDALAVGVAQSLSDGGGTWEAFLPLLISVFVITAASVLAGIFGGKTLGSHFGRWAEIAGGAVLVIIGVTILLS